MTWPEGYCLHQTSNPPLASHSRCLYPARPCARRDYHLLRRQRTLHHRRPGNRVLRPWRVKVVSQRILRILAECHKKNTWGAPLEAIIQEGFEAGLLPPVCASMQTGILQVRQPGEPTWPSGLEAVFIR